jgi:hypothetical protein
VRWEHACLAAQAGLLGFSLYLRPAAHREPRDTWQHRSPPEQGGGVQCYGTRGSAGNLPSREVESKAAGHVAALKPSRAGRRGPVPWDTWQRRSPYEQGGRIQSRGTHGSTGALLSREAGSGAAGHMAAPEPGRQNPTL